MEGIVTISKEEYLRLRKAEEKLNRLEVAGIDNWGWYEDYLNEWMSIWESLERRRIEKL